MKDQISAPLDQSRLRQSFCRGLETYHQHAEVQALIAQELVQLMQQHGVPQALGKTLEFGCGTGHLTASLSRSFDPGALLLNDLVPESEAPLRQLLQQAGRAAEFRSGAIETLPLPADLDLIASASTVQWIEDLPGLLARLAQHLAPGGWLALSGFGRGQFRELQALGSAAAAPSYFDRDEWPGLLPAGLEIAVLRQRPVPLFFNSGLEVLRHLRKTGVNGQAGKRWSRSDLAEFDREYRRRFAVEGGLPLTYDAVWVLLRKLPA
ncbi:biotin synthesis protein, putative [Roseobacter sp. SK209-2-6]|uniref:methyltransferase domain-containing protein n=1 Tax=Roseobacter sp. SK209-2-6 TaxID=388739 RepID=UPI0000F3EF30|nr:methyltransferase domain-containing protein [Roseobacter sp. SK209-2-6]EBA15595.1 biotin synthesis protein, putative [Roseobacter sp. SK209-2-6]